MKLAISNIAWPADQERAVADLMADLEVAGVEIAPTKVWPNPLHATDVQVDDYRRFWAARGISIVAAQALLFGRPDLTLFESAEIRGRTFEYLDGIIRVCARLGAGALVFGSPKNRLIGSRDPAAVWQEAVDFFGRLGELAKTAGTVIALEANPPEYGADFVTHAADALRLVEAVNHPGFRVHLDSACMTMAVDDPNAIIPHVAPLLAHFHVAEPHLAPIGEGSVDHARFAAELSAIHYAGWVSIEMRPTQPFEVQHIRHAILRARTGYGIQ